MRRAKVVAGLVIFLLFFGTAMIDALRRHAWATCSLYVLLALLFLKSGSRGRDEHSQAPLPDRRPAFKP